MKALITGINGFTGRYVRQELEQAGYDVFGTIYREKPANDHLINLDLTDADATAKYIRQLRPDVVIHLAAITFVPHGDLAEIYQTNVIGSLNLLSALLKADCRPKKVLLASSAQVYGSGYNDPEKVIDEVCPLRPGNDYGVSKLAMETLAGLCREKLPIVVTRPFNYTGVGQPARFLLPKIVDAFAAGEKIIELGNTEITRDFSDVRMVADCYRRLIDSEVSGDTFNVCSSTPTRFAEIITMMEQIAGYKIEIRTNPKFVRQNDNRYFVGSNQKLIETLGNIDLIDLASTLEWMYSESKIVR